MSAPELPDPADALQKYLEGAYASADTAAGQSGGTVHGAYLALRGEVACLLERAKRIRIFADRP